jgi:adenylate kinase family enzyme
VDYYRRMGILKEIDGVGEIDEIRDRLIRALGDEVA